MSDMLGGWQGVSALTASACVGLVVGFSAPDAVAAYVPGFADAALDDGLAQSLLFDLDLATEDDA